MTALQIPTPLFSAGIIVPYVDRLNDSTTGFLFGVKQYIGGYKGNSVAGVVPGKCLPPSNPHQNGNADHVPNSQLSSPVSAVRLSSSPPSSPTTHPTKNSRTRQANTTRKSKTSSCRTPSLVPTSPSKPSTRISSLSQLRHSRHTRSMNSSPSP